jgi:hypothetical protein
MPTADGGERLNSSLALRVWRTKSGDSELYYKRPFLYALQTREDVLVKCTLRIVTFSVLNEAMRRISLTIGSCQKEGRES